MRLFKQSAAMFVAMITCFQICAWAYTPSTPDTIQPWSENTWIMDGTAQEINQDLLVHFLQSHNIDSLDKYIKWFETNLVYLPDDGKDQWSQPMLTLVRGGGDCEDLAFLNVAVLKHFGINARVLGTQKDSNHHVFTVFKHQSRMFVFDNTRLIKTRVNTLDQIAVFLYKKYSLDYVLEVKLNPRSIKILYTKQVLQKLLSS